MYRVETHWFAEDSVEKTRGEVGFGRDGTGHALTVSFTGSILISRDTSRVLGNSCRQLSSITPGIGASVSSVRGGGNHGSPARRGQTNRVCQPLLQSHPGRRAPLSVRFSPRLSAISKQGSPTRLPREINKALIVSLLFIRGRKFCVSNDWKGRNRKRYNCAN